MLVKTKFGMKKLEKSKLNICYKENISNFKFLEAEIDTKTLRKNIDILRLFFIFLPLRAIEIKEYYHKNNRKNIIMKEYYKKRILS